VYFFLSEKVEPFLQGKERRAKYVIFYLRQAYPSNAQQLSLPFYLKKSNNITHNKTFEKRKLIHNKTHQKMLFVWSHLPLFILRGKR